MEIAKGHDPAIVARAKARSGIKGLFDDWAATYDDHMFATGHDPAVENLIKQAAELQKQYHDTPIFGRRVLEMSCGTGTLISFLSKYLPAEELAGMDIVANDLSEQMQAIARCKLAGIKTNITFTNHDIRELPFDRESFDTLVLSQTLPFLTDPMELMRENQEQGEKGEHRHVKTAAIKRAFDILRWGGYFIVVDEWPMKITKNNKTSLDTAIEEQFEENFRPIRERTTFRDKVMRNVPGARFVAELKARIDREHSMYIFIYRKDKDKAYNRGIHLPATEEEARRAGMTLEDTVKARLAAVKTVVKRFQSVDDHFVEYYRPINGERNYWADFLPLSSSRMEEAGTGDELPPESQAVLIAQKLHNLSDFERLELIEGSIDKLRRGGSLLIIDEWAAPSDSTNRIEKSKLRDSVVEEFHQRLIFEGALRQPIVPGYDSGMYGYMFRKKY